MFFLYFWKVFGRILADKNIDLFLHYKMLSTFPSVSLTTVDGRNPVIAWDVQKKLSWESKGIYPQSHQPQETSPYFLGLFEHHDLYVTIPSLRPYFLGGAGGFWGHEPCIIEVADQDGRTLEGCHFGHREEAEDVVFLNVYSYLHWEALKSMLLKRDWLGTKCRF